MISGLFGLLVLTIAMGQIGGFVLPGGAVVFVHDIVLSLLLPFLIFRQVRAGKWSVPVLVKPLAIFIGIAAFSLVANVFRFTPSQLWIALLYLLRYTAYAMTYVVLVQSGISGNTLRRGLFFLGAAVVVLGGVQMILYPDLRNLEYLGWDPHYLRLFSTFLDPNFTGILIVLTILLGQTVRIMNKPYYVRIIQAVLLAALYSTYSRSSYLALLAAFGMYALIKRKFAAVAAGLAFLLIVLVIPTPGGKTLRLLRDDSTAARFGNFSSNLFLGLKSPVFGVGFNTVPFIRQTPMEAGNTYVSRSRSGIDSSILFVFVTTGFAGVLAYVNLLYHAFVRNRAKGKSPVDPGAVRLCIGTALLVHSLFNNSLFYPHIVLWIWIYLSSLEAISST